MISREDASYWAVEASRLIRGVTTSVDLEKSLVFMDTVERIRILTRVVETTSHGEDLLDISSPDKFAAMSRNFQSTPSGYLSFFRHKVHILSQSSPS